MSARNILFTISYDGSGYHGWQTQPGSKTIQETLNQAVSSLVGKKVTFHGASRTDAGVSALGQKALIQITDCPIPTENFQKALNDRLPEDIVIIDSAEMPIGFDVIGAVKSKLYRYTIHTGPVRPVMDIKHCWHIPNKLDTEAMNQAAQLLTGEKDFKSFAAAADKRQSLVRTIIRCDVTEDGDRIYIETEGNGFLYNMVRNIAGTLVEIGLGRWKPEKITEILEAKDRTAAGAIAPPQGLCLVWIKY